MDELKWKPQNTFFKQTPLFIIVHAISEFIKDTNGDFGPKGKVYTCQEFLKTIGLSYHGFFFPDGRYEEAQDIKKVAFHAGVSRIEGIANLNSYSLGFSFIVEGLNSYAEFKAKMKITTTYTNSQYVAGSEVIAIQAKRLGIDETKIYRHSDVSGKDIRPTGFKVDPGFGFDYFRLQAMVKAELLNLQ